MRASSVERIIQAITALDCPIVNRTHVVPEIATYENRKIPVRLLRTENLVLESLDSMGGELSDGFFTKNDANKLEEYRSLMTQGSSMNFSIWMRHTSLGHLTCFHFEIGQADCIAGFHDMSDIPSNDPAQRLEWLDYLINHLELPIDLALQDALYVPIHQLGGKVDVSRTAYLSEGQKTEDPLPSMINVNLVNETSQSLFDRLQRLLHQPDFQRVGCHSFFTKLRMRFRPAHDDVTDEWSLNLRGTTSENLNQFHAFQNVVLPSDRIGVSFFWHLKDYNYFREMTPLANAAVYGFASQSLMDFEFAPGKEARLDLLANSWGFFQGVISFDAMEHAEEVSTLLGIKLKYAYD